MVIMAYSNHILSLPDAVLIFNLLESPLKCYPYYCLHFPNEEIKVSRDSVTYFPGSHSSQIAQLGPERAVPKHPHPPGSRHSQIGHAVT